MKVGYRLFIVLAVFAIGVLVSPVYSMMDPGDIVGIWLLDEGDDDVAKDSSGNGHDGQVAEGLNWVDGKFGKALEFPGTAPNFVTIPHDDSLSLDTWSVTAWIKAENTDYYAEVVGKMSPDVDERNYAIQLNINDGVRRPHFTTGVSQYKLVAGSTGLYDSEWHHVAGTYDKESLSVYVDGVLEASQAINNTPDTAESPLLIGSLSVLYEQFKGVIDEVGVFNVGLTEDEVISIMNNGLAQATGLTAVSSVDKLAVTWASIKTRD